MMHKGSNANTCIRVSYVRIFTMTKKAMLTTGIADRVAFGVSPPKRGLVGPTICTRTTRLGRGYWHHRFFGDLSGRVGEFLGVD